MALTKVTGQVINDTTGLVVGVTTVGGGLSATDGFFSGIVTFSQGVSIGGTLTYEDVTNIDSVGLITARAGVVVGSGITLSKDGDGFFTGVVTATSYAGDGSGLTGIAATDNVRTGILDVAGVGTFRNDVNVPDKIIHLGDTDTAIRFPAADTVSVETGGSEALRVDSSGRLLLGTTTEGHNNAENLTVSASGAAGITIRSTGNNCHLYFSDATSGAGEYVGQITYNHSSDYINFITNGSERLRIGSAGQLGIGGANYGTSGQVLRSQGSSSAVEWATPSGWVFGTAADYDQWNSTTDVRFSGWPTNWKQIRINFVDISSNANAYIQYFISKSSDTNSRIASGYQTQSGYYGAATAIDSVTNMGRFSGTASSSYSMTGYVNFHNFNGNTIRYEGQLSEDGNSYIFVTNGHVDCDPVTDMTHIFFRCQGYSYDSGKFSIDYLA